MSPALLTAPSGIAPLPIAPIADAIADQGWWCGHGIIDHATARRWRADLALRIWRQGTTAQVGRGSGLRFDRSRRGDRICWLEDEPAAPWHDWLQILEELRSGLGDRLSLGLHGIEAIASRYSGTARYLRHLDQHHGVRLLTTVLSLNPDWRPGDGGDLLLDADSDDGPLSFAPEAGTLLVFRADMPHEVLPVRGSRYAITAWLKH